MSTEYEEFKNYMKQKKYKLAGRFARQEYLNGPEQNVFWLTQAAIALLRGGNKKEAYNVIKEALTLKPADPYVIVVAADILLESRKYDEALEYYKEILFNGKLKLRAQKGILNCLIYLKNWENILVNISDWEMMPDERSRYKVKALNGLGRLEDAIDECRKWLKIKPDNSQALWELTELEIMQDGIDAIFLRLGKMAKIPSLPGIYKEIYASIAKRAGKPELALNQYKKLEGSGHRVQKKEAFLLAKTGREIEAIPILEEFLKLEPWDKYLNASYGAACTRIGKIDRAINFYNKLIGLFPEEKTIYGRIKKLKNKLEKII